MKSMYRISNITINAVKLPRVLMHIGEIKLEDKTDRFIIFDQMISISNCLYSTVWPAGAVKTVANTVESERSAKN